MVSAAVIGTVLQKAAAVASKSWEYGTVAEAFLEWDSPKVSVWNEPFPNGEVPTLNVDQTSALSYVKSHIQTDGDQLYKDEAAGDPASLGVSAVLIGKSDGKYWDAAKRQRDHLLNKVPRWNNGAISHREKEKQVWADSVYMVPPFLAYYAVASNDVNALKESANQCKLYHEVLSDQQGPWLHIVAENWGDRALWSSGNGWAAAGMSRVFATMKNSPLASQTQDEQGMLKDFVKEIIDGAMTMDNDDSGLLRNYLNDTAWWGEISGTSLLAATALRMAKLEPETFDGKYVDWASKKMEAVDGKINEGSGIVSPAVNPEDWHDQKQFTSGSPEGQSFVVLMHAAYRDLKGEQQ